MIIRFPRNRDIAEKWNSSLGIDANKILHGFVCFDHFEKKCFARSDRSGLRADAVPTIFERYLDSSPPTIATANSAEKMASPVSHSSPPLISPTVARSNRSRLRANAVPTIFGSHLSSSPPSISPTVAIANSSSQIFLSPPPLSSTVALAGCFSSQCEECLKKDELIQIKDAQIRTLRNKLRKEKKKTWHLEVMKQKLQTAFSELKKQSLIDEELSRALEVCSLLMPVNKKTHLCLLLLEINLHIIKLGFQK